MRRANNNGRRGAFPRVAGSMRLLSSSTIRGERHMVTPTSLAGASGEWRRSENNPFENSWTLPDKTEYRLRIPGRLAICASRPSQIRSPVLKRGVRVVRPSGRTSVCFAACLKTSRSTSLSPRRCSSRDRDYGRRIDHVARHPARAEAELQAVLVRATESRRRRVARSRRPGSAGRRLQRHPRRSAGDRMPERRCRSAGSRCLFPSWPRCSTTTCC